MKNKDTIQSLTESLGFNDEAHFMASAKLSATLTYQMYMEECETMVDKFKMFYQLYEERFTRRVEVDLLPEHMQEEFEFLNNLCNIGTDIEKMLKEKEVNTF